MDLSNYVVEIAEATKNLSPEDITLFAQSEAILDRMIELKGLSKEPDALSRIPAGTLSLTKECVPVLESIGRSVGTTHDLYKLQTRKLFNIVINSSAHWSKLWMMGVKTGSNNASDKDSNAQVYAYQLCMKEMCKLKFYGADKEEFDKKYNGMVGTSPTPTSSGGCLSAILLFLVGTASIIGLTYFGFGYFLT